MGVLLVGIVFFNVDLLRMNRAITASARRATQLKQRERAAALEEARLASSKRIQEAAAATGW